MKKVIKNIFNEMDWKYTIYSILKYVRYFFLYVLNVEILKLIFKGLSKMFTSDYHAYFKGDDTAIIMSVISIVGVVVMLWFSCLLFHGLFFKDEQKPITYYFNKVIVELVRIPLIVVPFLGIYCYYLDFKTGVWNFDFFMASKIFPLLIINVVLKLILKLMYKEEHFTRVVIGSGVSTKEHNPYARKD